MSRPEARSPADSDPSKRRERLLTLEFARGVAALVVTVRHLCVHAFEIPAVDMFIPVPSATAVMFFFVLSGTVLAKAHPLGRSSTTSAVGFLVLRAWRVYPIYYVVLALTLFQWSFLYKPDGLLLWLPSSPITTPIDSAAARLIIPQAWTLQWEAVFYITYAFMLLVGLRLTSIVAWVLWIVFWNTWPDGAFGLEDMSFVQLTSHPACLLFVTGVVVAETVERFSPGHIVATLVLGLGLASIALDISNHRFGVLLPVTVPGFAFSATGLGMTVAGAVWIERIGLFRLGSWAIILGRVSYPLYLVHWFAMDITFAMLQSWSVDTGQHPFVYAAIAFTACVVGGLVLGYTIDRPLQRIGRIVSQRLVRVSA